MNYLSRRLAASFCSDISSTIVRKLKNSLKAANVEIKNESHRHNRGPNSHFNVVVVSDEFKSKPHVERYKMVHSTLSEEIEQLHALTLTCRTIEEWESSPEKNKSPGCMNKSKGK